MSLFVVSRRKIVFQQMALGHSMVIYVPNTEQVQTFKDAAGTGGAAPAGLAGKAVARGPQLARVTKGQRTIFGQLPTELRERRERLKVWLAEDIAPPEADAFFYIFNPQVVVHGIRERNDEGKLVWRTAQISLSTTDSDSKPLEAALADYMFANQGQNVCVAVVNDLKLFKSVQEIASPLGLTPVPLSTLKPQTGVPPLYGHLNYTWIHLAMMVLGVCVVLGMAGYYFTKQLEVSKVEKDIDNLTAQINAVSINPRVGHIKQAQEVLGAIERGYKISPTSLLMAAGDAMVPFGEVQQIQIGTVNPERLTALGLTSDESLQPLEVTVNNTLDVLLVDQEERAKTMLASAPWVRQIVRHGGGGETSTFIVLLTTSVADTAREVQP